MTTQQQIAQLLHSSSQQNNYSQSFIGEQASQKSEADMNQQPSKSQKSQSSLDSFQILDKYNQSNIKKQPKDTKPATFTKTAKAQKVPQIKQTLGLDDFEDDEVVESKVVGKQKKQEKKESQKEEEYIYSQENFQEESVSRKQKEIDQLLRDSEGEGEEEVPEEKSGRFSESLEEELPKRQTTPKAKPPEPQPIKKAASTNPAIGGKRAETAKPADTSIRNFVKTGKAVEEGKVMGPAKRPATAKPAAMIKPTTSVTITQKKPAVTTTTKQPTKQQPKSPPKPTPKSPPKPTKPPQKLPQNSPTPKPPPPQKSLLPEQQSIQQQFIQQQMAQQISQQAISLNESVHQQSQKQHIQSSQQVFSQFIESKDTASRHNESPVQSPTRKNVKREEIVHEEQGDSSSKKSSQKKRSQSPPLPKPSAFIPKVISLTEIKQNTEELKKVADVKKKQPTDNKKPPSVSKPPIPTTQKQPKPPNNPNPIATRPISSNKLNPASSSITSGLTPVMLEKRELEKQKQRQKQKQERQRQQQQTQAKKQRDERVQKMQQQRKQFQRNKKQKQKRQRQQRQKQEQQREQAKKNEKEMLKETRANMVAEMEKRKEKEALEKIERLKRELGVKLKEKEGKKKPQSAVKLRRESKAKKDIDDGEFEVEEDFGDNATAGPHHPLQPPPISHHPTAKSLKSKSSSLHPQALQTAHRLTSEKHQKKLQDTLLQLQSIQKLKQLKKQPKPPKPEQVKKLIRILKDDENRNIKQEQVKEKKDENSVRIRQLKDQLNKLRREQKTLKERIVRQQEIANRLKMKIRIEEKQENVVILDKRKNQYTSFGLVGDLKKITPTIQTTSLPSTQNISQQSITEKFIQYFQSKNYQLTDIFNILDVNSDGMLTLKQIKQICTRMQVLTQPQLNQLMKILDYNGDASITKDEFEFIIGAELEKRTLMNRILGDIKVSNPIEIQERIVDMKARMKYMEEMVEGEKGSDNNMPESDTRYEKLLVKLKSLEDKLQRRRIATSNNKHATSSLQHQSLLTEQLHTCQSQYSDQLRLYELIKTQVDGNVQTKTRQLKDRIEQQLRCRQALYTLQNQLQQKTLRLATYQKIVESKKRHFEQSQQQQRNRQQRLKETAQYRADIVSEKNRTEGNTKLMEMNLLAAVLRIQRNFRRRKAQREFDRIKKEAAGGGKK